MNTQQPNNRLTIVFFLFVAFYGFLVLSLYRVQIQRADFFKDRAQKQYATTMTVTPPREEIFDRSGVQPLALNQEAIAAFVVPSKLKHSDSLLSFLSEHFKGAAKRLERSRTSQLLYIKRRLTPADLELIEQCDVPDIKFLKEPSRYYPVAGIGPIVGITNIDNQGMLIFNQGERK